MSAPDVSVIIPTRDRPHYLAAALESVRAQKGVSFEILVVDGGADDTVEKLVSAFGSGARTIRLPGEGRSAARNAGIQAARAEMIAFLDDDDVWLPGKLAGQLKRMRGDPDVGLLHTFVQGMDAEGRPDPALSRSLRLQDEEASRRGYSYHEICRRCIMRLTTVMIRRKVLHDVGLFDENLVGFEDWDLYLRIAREHRIEVLREVTALMRAHAKQTPHDEFVRGREITSRRNLVWLAGEPASVDRQRARAYLHAHLAHVYHMRRRSWQAQRAALRCVALHPPALLEPDLAKRFFSPLQGLYRILGVRA